MKKIIDYGDGIYAVDSDYVRPEFAAVHLVIENGHAALIDTGCNDSLPNVLSALGCLGVPVSQVDYVFLTHIHLDHAGGAGLMMQTFPNARLVVHPRGVRHMIDPSRLIEGAIGVYGAESVERLYGTVLPVTPERIVEATPGLRISLEGRDFLVVDTPGHARHHIGIVDEQSRSVFTGDTFGVSYPEMLVDGRSFLVPTTTPVQFDPQAMHASIDLLMSHRPDAIYVTHFGKVNQVHLAARDMHRHIDAFVAIAVREQERVLDRQERILMGLEKWLITEADSFGCLLPAPRILEIFANDLELNAQGLSCWIDSRS